MIYTCKYIHIYIYMYIYIYTYRYIYIQPPHQVKRTSHKKITFRQQQIGYTSRCNWNCFTNGPWKLRFFFNLMGGFPDFLVQGSLLKHFLYKSYTNRRIPWFSSPGTVSNPVCSIPPNFFKREVGQDLRNPFTILM